MRPLAPAWLTVFALPLISLSQDKVNQNSLVLQDFSKRIADYVQLHKAARAEVHGLKPTASPGEITRYQQKLAHRIREMRKHVSEGSIFTPEIAAQFRHLIGQTMQGSTGMRVQKSLKDAEPVKLPRLQVNSSYPEGIPLQSSPPSFLSNLPKLPPEVEYRVVGHDLAVRDVDANVIVDLARNVVP